MTHHQPEERRHAKRGPINGKVGWALAAMDQMKTLIGVVVIVIFALGFKWSTPADELANIRAEMRASLANISTQLTQSQTKQLELEKMVKSLTRLQCDKVTLRDARLAQLECGAIQ